jgi:multimeric flavodoxin WrbA
MTTSGAKRAYAEVIRPEKVPECGLMYRRKDRCSFDHILGPAVAVGSPVYLGNMVGEVKTFFDN